MTKDGTRRHDKAREDTARQEQTRQDRSRHGKARKARARGHGMFPTQMSQAHCRFYPSYPAGSLDSKSVTMIVWKISEKGLQIGKLSRTEKLEKRGAFLEQLLEKF